MGGPVRPGLVVSSVVQGGFIDVIPLTGGSIEFELGKKEKTPTKFCFILTGTNG